MSNFEIASVLMLGAFAATLAMASAPVHAQTAAPPAASPQAPAMQVAPAPAAVPQNQTTRQDVEAAFLRADTNHDGKLDRKEAERFPAVAQRFDQIDTDHDNFISMGELGKAAGS